MDIAKLSISQLNKLLVNVNREIAKRGAKSKADVLKEAQKIAAAAGLSLADLFGATPAKRGRKPKVERESGAEPVAKAKGRAKFRNPANPAQKWSGHGRRPAWVIAHLEAGGQIDALKFGRKAPEASAEDSLVASPAVSTEGDAPAVA